MNLLDTVLLSIHGIFGVLWIAFEFVLMVSLLRAKENNTAGNGIRVGMMGSRGMGGLTIILGIILFALLSSESKLPSFTSMQGILLLIGVALAIIVYVVLNEGLLFRKLIAKDANLSGLRRLSGISAVLTLLVLILMVIGAM